jgi:tetratricopeptide (TPR) repeat protein
MSQFSSFRSLFAVFFAAGLIAALEIIHVRNGFHRTAPANVNDPQVMESLANTYYELYPERGMPHYVRGAVAIKQENYQSAREHLERALALNNFGENVLYDHAVNLIRLGESQDLIDASIRRWRWHYPKSRRPNPATLDIYPQDVPSSPEDSPEYLAGRAALLNLNFEEARRYFEEDLAAGCTSEQLLYNYSLTLLFLEETSDVVDDAIDQWRAHYPDSNRLDPREAYRRMSQ